MKRNHSCAITTLKNRCLFQSLERAIKWGWFEQLSFQNSKVSSALARTTSLRKVNCFKVIQKCKNLPEHVQPLIEATCYKIATIVALSRFGRHAVIFKKIVCTSLRLIGAEKHLAFLAIVNSRGLQLKHIINTPLCLNAFVYLTSCYYVSVVEKMSLPEIYRCFDLQKLIAACFRCNTSLVSLQCF